MCHISNLAYGTRHHKLPQDLSLILKNHPINSLEFLLQELSTINRMDANTPRVMPGELIEGKPSMSHVAGTRVPAINLTHPPRRPKRTVFATTGAFCTNGFLIVIFR